MRRIVNKQFKNDIDNVRVGISVSFTSKGIFTPTYTTAQQIKSNLIDLLLTNRGERFFDTDYGCDLYRKIYEPLSLQSNVESTIIPAINRYIPQITINSVDVSNEYENYTLFIKIDYSINHTGVQDTVSIAI